MQILEDMSLFAVVVDRGGFSHAAKFLGLSNGVVSRRIAELEKKLGITLLKRTTRQIHLTTEGELLWQHAKRIQGEMQQALDVLNASAENMKGTLRVSAPIFFGRKILLKTVRHFLNNHQEMSVSLNLSNHYLEPLSGNIDLLIRATGYLDRTYLPDSSMKQKQLQKYQLKLYASTDYLKEHSLPTLLTLAQHNIIGYAFDDMKIEEKWQVHTGRAFESMTLQPKLKCNDMGAVLEAALAGYGIAKLPDFALHESPENALVEVLPEYDWGTMVFYAVYPNQPFLPKSTRLFLDYLSEHLQ